MGGASAGHDGRARRGQGSDHGRSIFHRNGAGRRRNRSQGKESSNDRRNWSYRPRGDTSQANFTSSSTDGSGKSPVPEFTTSSKRQVARSLAEFASSAALLGRLTMSDDRSMPVSCNHAHARTTAIDSAAAAVKKHTADVQQAYKHLGLKDISRISVLPLLSSINPSDAAQQLTRSVRASTSDHLMIYNDGSHEGLSSTNWIPGREYPSRNLSRAPSRLTSP